MADMSYTLSHIPEDLERALRREAEATRTSFDQALTNALRRDVALPRKRRDLSHIAGTLDPDPDPDPEFDEIMEEF